jgi:hypothetical protein
MTQRRTTERRFYNIDTNVERLNVERLNVDYGWRSNVERRTSNVERQTSNVEPTPRGLNQGPNMLDWPPVIVNVYNVDL